MRDFKRLICKIEALSQQHKAPVADGREKKLFPNRTLLRKIYFQESRFLRLFGRSSDSLGFILRNVLLSSGSSWTLLSVDNGYGFRLGFSVIFCLRQSHLITLLFIFGMLHSIHRISYCISLIVCVRIITVIYTYLINVQVPARVTRLRQ